MTESKAFQGEVWPTELLGNLCDIVIGRTPSRNRPEFWDGEHPWLSIADMNQGPLIQTTKERITSLGVTQSGSRLIPRGTVLLSFKLSIGKVAVTGIDTYTNEAIAALPIVEPDKLLRKFLFWALRCIRLDEEVDAAAKGRTLNKSKLIRLAIPLPPLDIQQRIAEVLDKSDALLRQRRESRQLLGMLRQSMFVTMFGELGTNPKDWPETTVGNILLDGPQNGLYQPASDYGSGTRILRIDGFYDGVVIDEQRLKRLRLLPGSEQLYLLREGDIVVNRVNSLEYLGKSAVVPRFSEPVVFESNIMRMGIDRARMDPRFLIALLQTPYIKYQIASCAKKAVNQASINQTDVKELRIYEPPISMQQQYVFRIELLTQLLENIVAQETELMAFCSSLQDRAFKGELELDHLVLDSIDQAYPDFNTEEYAAKPNQSAAIFLHAPGDREVALRELDATLRKDGPIPWSAEYFKYRVLGRMPVPFSFDDVMGKVGGIFDDAPPYEEIKDMFLELLGQGENPALLRQRFDLQVDPETNEVSGRKEIVFEPIS